MSEFVELQDREVPPQLIVVREEHIKNYTLKFITFNEGDSIWLFRDGELRGVFSWTGMIQFNEFKQFICYFLTQLMGCCSDNGNQKQLQRMQIMRWLSVESNKAFIAWGNAIVWRGYSSRRVDVYVG